MKWDTGGLEKTFKGEILISSQFLLSVLVSRVGTLNRSSAGRVGEVAEGESGRKVWLVLSPSVWRNSGAEEDLMEDVCQLCCVCGCLVSVITTVWCAHAHTLHKINYGFLDVFV